MKALSQILALALLSNSAFAIQPPMSSVTQEDQVSALTTPNYYVASSAVIAAGGAAFAANKLFRAAFRITSPDMERLSKDIDALNEELGKANPEVVAAQRELEAAQKLNSTEEITEAQRKIQASIERFRNMQHPDVLVHLNGIGANDPQTFLSDLQKAQQKLEEQAKANTLTMEQKARAVTQAQEKLKFAEAKAGSAADVLITQLRDKQNSLKVERTKAIWSSAKLRGLRIFGGTTCAVLTAGGLVIAGFSATPHLATPIERAQIYSELSKDKDDDLD